ncbi:LAME_0C02080g1_1 [Lachancea meyersii CBS 8951]|uniref:LAME_0C02080g1_1 n=1 Tax=Lachancea meyersii CBS 8951 TaxID=1266667 RepID=A0A1G4IZI6_9SACH|nr:LAME_0C02080g1_1 [Lachancea meyersii CBS 8951]
MTLDKPRQVLEMVNGIYYAHGLRKIAPYYHSRTSFAKGRWLGRQLLEVLSDELKALSSEQYSLGIQRQEFQIVRNACALSVPETFTAKIENKDIIKTISHKHEPPVRQWCSDESDTEAGKKIGGFEIVHECSDLLVLNKPSGIPIHPTGRYYKNSMVEVLKNQGTDAYPTHRLDKITSGVLIMAKNPYMANKIQGQIRQRTMQKTYLARVEGCFPKVQDSHALGKGCLPSATEACADENKATVEDSEIYTIELKKQFPAAFSVARNATTKFYPVRYYAASNQTLVACQPITGRTHQIRIHLARMGHPIVNDPFYNKKNTKFPRRLQFMLDVYNWNIGSISSERLESYFKDFLRESNSFHDGEPSSIREECKECGINLYPDPQLHDLQLYLHAWKYRDSTGDLDYETSLPIWALDHNLELQAAMKE